MHLFVSADERGKINFFDASYNKNDTNEHKNITSL